MTTLRDVIHKKGGDIYSIQPDASVFEALKVMADKNTGALLVLADALEQLPEDYRQVIMLRHLEGLPFAEVATRMGKTVPSVTQVKDIMTSKVLYAQASQTLEECIAIMIDKNIRHLPVFEDQELIGLISARDALKEMVDQQKFVISQLEHYITGGGR